MPLWRNSRDKNFADVEILELEGTVERFLGLQLDGGDLASLDPHAAIENGACAIIVARGQAYLQSHLALQVAAATHATQGIRELQ